FCTTIWLYVSNPGGTWQEPAERGICTLEPLRADVGVMVRMLEAVAVDDPLAGLRRPAPVYSWMLVGDARRRWSSASKVLSTLGGSGGSRVHLMQPVDEDLVDVRRAFFLYPMSAAR